MGASWTKFYDNYNKPKKDLYHMVKWQNEMMEVESAKLRDQYSTDIERIKHINNDLLGWNQLNFILWLIYYVIFFVIAYLLYNRESEKIVLTKNQKIYLGLGFLLFPFLITSLEILIYNFVVFIISLIQGIPYPKHGDKQPTLSFLDALPPIYY
jgi:uncharacterized membrane protein|tara:strand:- start:134 stop:595 length:462 start_codon:yes stop_codon:yes gene_type:complete